ncbi:MAG: hypothetical protein WC549_07945 [Actinomycetota bacterium]
MNFLSIIAWLSSIETEVIYGVGAILASIASIIYLLWYLAKKR